MKDFVYFDIMSRYFEVKVVKWDILFIFMSIMRWVIIFIQQISTLIKGSVLIFPCIPSPEKEDSSITTDINFSFTRENSKDEIKNT